MLAASKVKVSGSEKESKKIESFTFVVVEQQRQRNVQKSVFTCKVVFLLIRPIVVGVVVCFFFLPFSMPSPFSITRFCE